jgi:streptogramin lyase
MSVDGRLTVYSSPFTEHPSDITAGPDGNLWVAEEHRLARVTTRGDTIELPPMRVDPYLDALTAGPDGNVWLAWEEGVGRSTPHGEIRLWKPPGELGIGGSTNGSIAAGPMAISGSAASMAMRCFFSPAGVGTRVRTAGFAPEQVTAGPDGNIYYTYWRGVGRVLRMAAVA